MNEEYLWDKSGEPDPEIQQLEQILETLRYQPKPLGLAGEVPSRRRNRYLPLLAIAATLLVALLAGGLWLRTRSKTAPQLHDARMESPKPQQVNSSTENNKTSHVVESASNRRDTQLKIKEVRHSRALRDSNMTAREREQALAAKEQLMIALRLTSEKLNLAHRKAQGAPLNQIRNQHKVG